MMESKQGKKKLSSGVLELKFMKKSKEKARIQDDQEQQQLLYADQLSTLNSTTDKVVLMGSHFDLMKYLPCRLSFGGMEPTIEKLNADKLTGLYEVSKEEEEPEKEENVDFTKEEMAAHFSALNETLNKKFNKRKSDDFDEGNYTMPKPPKKKRNMKNPN